MPSKLKDKAERAQPGPQRVLAPVVALVTLCACAGGPIELPPPRPLVVSSGARLSADPDRLKTIHEWVTLEMQNIREDPTFLIESIPGTEPTYPWETLIISGDTARFQFGRGNPDVDTSFMIYAHLHMMKRMGRLEEWFPDGGGLEGYELERGIVDRMADSWLLGRTIFGTQPSRVLDELIYAKEGGYLDAFLFTARPNDFEQAREAWERANPGGMEQYHTWFRDTFGTEPPGIRGSR